MPSTSPALDVRPYDALMLYSFGGPDRPEDVVPFLRNVTAGKGIPDARLEEVGEHYYAFGGKSPINEQNLALKGALEKELAERGIDLPIVWGNRNWAPYTTDAVDELEAMGARRAVALVTSAYSSYSGCRQYREDLAVVLDQRGQLGPDGSTGVQFDKLRAYFNTPGFVQGNVDAVTEAFAALAGKGGDPAAARLVFVTHSVPTTMEAASGVGHATYSEQHLDIAALIAAQVGEALGHPVDWELAYCSRSGPPHQPWLEPDVNDLLGTLADRGVRDVVLSPIGFVSDHMEVAYDLDTEALDTARSLGMTAVRAGTVGTRAVFVKQLVDLVLERAAIARGESVDEATVGAFPAFPSITPNDCCLRVHEQPSGIPALCSEDMHR
ncbi:Ferrochelatase [Xylanimonas cellulosilytica DSM 15894]|uniref:Coproporphyrin III ferrochelatase n=1 Tax=Xylanimonas cellulosilytica (strain DSM 15894 / JCM 12276 / CECT 5975 / KCTC 9989 / LMG 20990 / NBRC 107835 / XIL07) TaxID=446471 RepID=D1BX70_XYLCX|nr:ferrochelatase [Xylanimonas cellulosilytica]ACZ31638.1 Ferrochelatase [Xylanimonas cellulosilytica DSM 15894]